MLLSLRRLLLLLLLLLVCIRKAPALNAHLCEGYSGPDGRLHAGFYCPRLTDPPTRVYCCRPGGIRALKSCCSRTALGGNSSATAAAPRAELRRPLLLPLLGVGLYGCLVLALMAADLLHFLRRRRSSAAARPEDAAGKARTGRAPARVGRGLE